MKALRPYLNVAAALSSLTLAVCFILYRTGRLNFWNSTPKPAEAQAAAPSDATQYEATEGDLALIDRMSGSKSEVPLIKSEPKAGHVFKNINGGDVEESVSRTLPQKNDPRRAMLSGSKSSAMIESRVPAAEPEKPRDLSDIVPPPDSTERVKPRTVFPGSKAPFPGFINAPENSPPTKSTQSEKPSRQLLPGSKSRAILDSAADLEQMKKEMNKWLDGKEDKKPAKPTAEENLKNGFKFDYSVNPYDSNNQSATPDPPPSGTTTPTAPTPPPAPKRKVMGGSKSAVMVEPETNKPPASKK